MPLLETHAHAAPQYAAYAASLGYACHLAARTRAYARAPLAVCPFWIEPAIWLGQIRFLFDRRGQPVSYFTYAYLSEAVELRLLSDPKVTLHLSEWKEGDRIWILDLVVMPGYLPSAMRQIADEFARADAVRYLRRFPDGTPKKTVRLNRTARGLRLAARGSDADVAR